MLFFLRKIEKKNTGIFGEIAVNLELLERNLGPLGEKQHIPIRISHLDCTTSFSTRKRCLPLEHPALPTLQATCLPYPRISFLFFKPGNYRCRVISVFRMLCQSCLILPRFAGFGTVRMLPQRSNLATNVYNFVEESTPPPTPTTEFHKTGKKNPATLS